MLARVSLYMIGKGIDSSGKPLNAIVTVRGDGGFGLRFHSVDEKTDCRTRSNVNFNPGQWTWIETC